MTLEPAIQIILIFLILLGMWEYLGTPDLVLWNPGHMFAWYLFFSVSQTIKGTAPLYQCTTTIVNSFGFV